MQSWILMKKLVTRLRADSLFLPYRDLEMPLIPVMVRRRLRVCLCVCARARVCVCVSLSMAQCARSVGSGDG